ncbi:MAG: XdhC family protein [Desulfobacula sp.]|nr:XdhC family protein [Desulfobacula sp.]
MGENIYIKVYDLLSSGQKIVLAKTIRRSGSTPRDVGSMCIITQKGELIGTIGGGTLEYRVQKRASEILKQEKSFIYRFRLTSEDLAGAGMICGGDVDLYLEPLFPENTKMVSLFKTVRQQIADNRPGILVTRIEDDIPAMDTEARMFIKEDGKTFGTIPGIDPGKINIAKNTPYDLISFDNKKMDLFVEKIGLNPRIFLFGAGHVSMFVAQLAKTVGFDITLIDDRPKFANKERFPGADEILITDFDQAFEQLNISQNSYLLIITRGHLHDKVVLQYALGTNASYIGMIGSTKKRNTIYRALMDEGFSKDELAKVYSPIGIDINAETPEEIAVSIVGELIKKRAPVKKKKNLIV